MTFVCTQCLGLISGLWGGSEDHTGVSEGRPHVHCGFPSGWYWRVHQKWRHADIRAYNGRSTRGQFITFWLLDVTSLANFHNFNQINSVGQSFAQLSTCKQIVCDFHWQFLYQKKFLPSYCKFVHLWIIFFWFIKTGYKATLTVKLDWLQFWPIHIFSDVFITAKRFQKEMKLSYYPGFLWQWKQIKVVQMEEHMFFLRKPIYCDPWQFFFQRFENFYSARMH